MSKAKGQQPEPPKPSVCQMQAVQWWGVKDDKGQWAFGGGQVCHYPCETIAKAHADSLSPRWKAVAFE